MTRDQAITEANHERDRTGIPQIISMNEHGEWAVRPVTRWTPLGWAAETDVVAI